VYDKLETYARAITNDSNRSINEILKHRHMLSKVHPTLDKASCSMSYSYLLLFFFFFFPFGNEYACYYLFMLHWIFMEFPSAFLGLERNFFNSRIFIILLKYIIKEKYFGDISIDIDIIVDTDFIIRYY
jgi:hypothetical protein